MIEEEEGATRVPVEGRHDPVTRKRQERPQPKQARP